MMFTGIVQALCPVVKLADEPSLRRLWVDLGSLSKELALGASVANNGVCLTVRQTQGSVVQFDVIQETLERTNLGTAQVGSQLNVERSYKVGDEVGGHIVSGHIACAIPVAKLEERENVRELRFDVPAEWQKYLHLKGFAALDGASLTISSCDEAAGQFGVSLIPETIDRTTLGRVKVGDFVNLEVDAQTQSVVDTVERVLASERYAHLRTG